MSRSSYDEAAVTPVALHCPQHANHQRVPSIGNGYFDGGKLHFVVAALYNFTGTDEADCIDVLQRTSIFLHQATLGQVQFGTIFLADGTLAIADAEVLLDKVNATSSSTRATLAVQGPRCLF